MYNIWDFGVTNFYFQMFHNLSLRLDIGPILQIRKKQNKNEAERSQSSQCPLVYEGEHRGLEFKLRLS